MQSSVSRLAVLINSDTNKFFDENFALKDKESEKLKIEYFRLKTQASDLQKLQKEEETVNNKISKNDALPSKSAKLINLIMKY